MCINRINVCISTWIIHVFFSYVLWEGVEAMAYHLLRAYSRVLIYKYHCYIKDGRTPWENGQILELGRKKYNMSLNILCQKVRKYLKNDGAMLRLHRSQWSGLGQFNQNKKV